MLGLLLDHKGQFGLVVHSARRGREHDGLGAAAHRVVVLGEHRRDLGDLHAGLNRVVPVVEADADELSWARHRGTQPRLVQLSGWLAPGDQVVGIFGQALLISQEARNVGANGGEIIDVVADDNARKLHAVGGLYAD